MKKLAAIISLVAVILAGCQDDGLATNVAKLQTENERLKKEMESGQAEVRAALELLEETQADWKRFEAAYDAELRAELEQNVTAAKALTSDIRQNEQTVETLLREFQELTVKAKELKEYCEEQMKIAGNANQVATLQTGLKSLEDKLGQLEKKLGNVSISQLNSKVRSLESEVRANRGRISRLR